LEVFLAVSIALIVLLGLFSDYLFKKIKLPGLIGMLIIGILCGPYVFDLMQSELLKVSADWRMVALIVILLRAGLELRRVYQRYLKVLSSPSSLLIFWVSHILKRRY
jgi:NhaP-type Na+/H+ or K+/H+ antiporter